MGVKLAGRIDGPSISHLARLRNISREASPSGVAGATGVLAASSLESRPWGERLSSVPPKRATIFGVAEQAGVSITTASDTARLRDLGRQNNGAGDGDHHAMLDAGPTRYAPPTGNSKLDEMLAEDLARDAPAP